MSHCRLKVSSIKTADVDLRNEEGRVDRNEEGRHKEDFFSLCFCFR